jgi:hypothetical protein
LLACAGAWFVFLAFRLWQAHHRLVAVISLGMIGLSAWVQPSIGTRTAPSSFEYFAYGATLAGLAWFFLLAVFLMATAWRLRTRRAVQ